MTNVTLRPGCAADAAQCGEICYRAFKAITDQHNHPSDFPAPDAAIGMLTGMLSHPGFYSVVAEVDGRIVGSNVLDERDSIAGVGPVTVDPDAQNVAVGRHLMSDVLDRAQKRGFAGVRLVQAAYHSRSLSLYTKLGFVVREPLACLQGPPIVVRIPGRDVRPATRSDLPACNELCQRVHGHDRGGELSDAIDQGTATVVEHSGRITGYATLIGIFGHAVGETNADMQALIAAAENIAGSGLLLPTRQTEMFRWCLENGLRVRHPWTLMSVGLYNEPAGVFLPSVAY